MNKKMKVIDLLNKIANGEEVPSRIEIDGYIYNWDIENFYKCERNEKDLLEIANIYNTKAFLELEVKELNKIEEESEIDIQGIEDLPDYDMGIEVNKNKINELIKAVRQLDNKIKEKE